MSYTITVEAELPDQPALASALTAMGADVTHNGGVIRKYTVRQGGDIVQVQDFPDAKMEPVPEAPLPLVAVHHPRTRRSYKLRKK
jgi:hypothetical protein